MANFLDRAMDWRRRAEELRTRAEDMMTPAARSSLLDMAAAFEHHAGNLDKPPANSPTPGKQRQPSPI